MSNDYLNWVPEYARLKDQRPMDDMQSFMQYGQQPTPAAQQFLSSPPQGREQEQINEYMRRLQVSIMAEHLKDGPANVVYGGGRIGYEAPWGNDSLTFGLNARGSKVKVDTPQRTIRDSQFNVSGGDIGYQSGPNSFEARFRNDPFMGKMFNLNYRREF